MFTDGIFISYFLNICKEFTCQNHNMPVNRTAVNKKEQPKVFDRCMGK